MKIWILMRLEMALPGSVAQTDTTVDVGTIPDNGGTASSAAKSSQFSD
jgi:predicted anti-sigma-YlaC factor YlaD